MTTNDPPTAGLTGAGDSPTGSVRSVRDMVRARRTIRAFRDEPVPREVVIDLLLEALWAPSPHNGQPWRFTVLFNREEKARLEEVLERELEREMRADGYDDERIALSLAHARGSIADAPVIILCSLVWQGLRDYHDDRRNRLEWATAMHSVGTVMQTFFLLATERGLGTRWQSAPMWHPEEVRGVLGLPAHYRPQMLAAVGYAADNGTVHPRRPIEQVMDLR